MTNIDVKETLILEKYPEILDILLFDHSSNKNIIWATKHYWRHGLGYKEDDFIVKDLITGKHGYVIKPRINKSEVEKKKRSKENAEVFTPSWVCNKQNNLVDNAWFGYDNSFNSENDTAWITTSKVKFKNNLNWKDYIDLERMEITCGEAPYLTSRYDAVSGKYIEPLNRIGLLDRKLRVVTENATNYDEWLSQVEESFKRIYGFDYQGDNVLLARENLLYTFVDFYHLRFKNEPSIETLKSIAEIISWNIWQMDGLKYVIPLSCYKQEIVQLCLFDDMQDEPDICRGCKTNNIYEHNGTYCKIKDWRANKLVKFIDLMK